MSSSPHWTSPPAGSSGRPAARTRSRRRRPGRCSGAVYSRLRPNSTGPRARGSVASDAAGHGGRTGVSALCSVGWRARAAVRLPAAVCTPGSAAFCFSAAGVAVGGRRLVPLETYEFPSLNCNCRYRHQTRRSAYRCPPPEARTRTPNDLSRRSPPRTKSRSHTHDALG